MIATRRGYLATLVAAALLLSASAVAKAPPDNWDGLVRVNAKRIDLLYLRPQADIRGYNRILLDPPEVAYDKNWRRDYDRSTTGHLVRLSDRDIRAAIDDGKQMLTESFREAFQKAGYKVAPSPDSDVLRLSISLLNVRLVAPEARSGVAMHTFSSETGSATLVVEARDSLSGQLLGRAVDQEVIDDWFVALRNDVTNRADFGQQFEEWARISAKGLKELQAAPVAR
jgi:Protein of unknown function (DUF3313)